MPTIQEVIGAILVFDLGIVPSYIADKALTAVARSEKAIELRKQLGISFKPQNFDEAYKAALIDYGIGKPQIILELFKYPDIQQAFRTWFSEDGKISVVSMLDAVLENTSVGQELMRRELDAKKEIHVFGAVFEKQVYQMRSLSDEMQDREIRILNISIHELVIQLAEKATLNDVKALSKQVEEQNKIVETFTERISEIAEPVEPVVYRDTVFRDRRQSELAAFLDMYDVEWKYFRYQEQLEPTVILPGPRFEITNLLGFPDKELLAVTIPFGISEAKFVWGERFRKEINKLSQDYEMLVVLRVTSAAFLSGESNVEPTIDFNELIPMRSQGETGADLWFVSSGKWEQYSWYICPDCEKLSAVFNLTQWDIRDGHEEPPETCPYCLDEFWEVCSHCDMDLYDTREANYCDYCENLWAKF